MSTTVIVSFGIALIAAGSFLIWYAPYREANIQAKYIKEAGKIQRIIAFQTPVISLGEANFHIIAPAHVPIIMDGHGPNVHAPTLYFQSTVPGTQEILYAWVESNRMKIGITIYDINRSIVSYINDNEWIVNKSPEIDCNYTTDRFEVVRIQKNGEVTPLLQIELLADRTLIGFETFLRDGTNLFVGNNSIEFRPAPVRVQNTLIPIFKYPSSDFHGVVR